MKNPNLQFSKHNQNIVVLDKLSDGQIQKIKKEWNRFNEKLLTMSSYWFSTFLGSELVSHCFVLHVKIESFRDRCLRSFDLLCEAVGSSSASVNDELSSLRVQTTMNSEKIT